MAENVLKTLKSFTVKTEEETVERFKQLKDAADFVTDGQFLTALIDRYELPQRVSDRTKDLERQLAETATKYEGEQAINQQLNRDLAVQRELVEALNRQVADLERQASELQAAANQNAEAANEQQLDYERQLAELAPKENQALISFTSDNLKVLDLVSARESKRRKQKWSRSHVINYFINARFVRGLLNGDLESVSDADLRRLGVSSKRAGKEDFEL